MGLLWKPHADSFKTTRNLQYMIKTGEVVKIYQNIVISILSFGKDFCIHKQHNDGGAVRETSQLSIDA